MTEHQDIVLKMLVEMQGDLGGVKTVTQQILEQQRVTNGRVSKHDQQIAQIHQTLAVDAYDDQRNRSEQDRRSRFKWQAIGLGTTIGVGVMGAAAVLLTTIH